MSGDFIYVADASVLELFSRCSKRDREELLRICRHLAQSPSQRGDYLQRTAAGRELEVKRFGKWLLTFWPDHPVCELRIVDVKKLIP